MAFTDIVLKARIGIKTASVRQLDRFGRAGIALAVDHHFRIFKLCFLRQQIAPFQITV